MAIEQANALASKKPDLIALQEVRPKAISALQKGFIDAGLNHTITSHQLAPDKSIFKGPRQYCLLIASRWPLRALNPSDFKVPWPERVLSVIVDVNGHEVEVHTTGVPPGVTNGWIKIEMLEGIYQRLARSCDKPRLLCGDFNTPQAETREGQTVTWGEEKDKDGCWRPAWPDESWTDRNGKTGTGMRWLRAERAVLTGLADFDLRDQFRKLRGFTAEEFSWYWSRNSRRIGRRLDHMFASASLNVVGCEYLHEFRESSLSDHSPILADCGFPSNSLSIN